MRKAREEAARQEAAEGLAAKHRAKVGVWQVFCCCGISVWP
jgi:hypothetical protein